MCFLQSVKFVSSHRIVAALSVGACSLLSLPTTGVAGFAGINVPSSSSQTLFVGSAMVGWAFTANADLTVTELGYFDFGGDGLGESHQVGIWQDGGALLGSVTVQPDGTLSDGFRYASTSPISLISGQKYVVAGFQSAQSDPFAIDGAASGGFSVAPGLGYDGSRISFNSGFSRPSGYYTAVGSDVFGPNLKFAAAVGSPVPEPGTALFSLGLIGAIALNRRRISAS